MVEWEAEGSVVSRVLWLLCACTVLADKRHAIWHCPVRNKTEREQSQTKQAIRKLTTQRGEVGQKAKNLPFSPEQIARQLSRGLSKQEGF